MKKLLFLVFIFFSQFTQAQLNFGIDLGVGLTTPIMKNQNRVAQSNRVISPLIGIYPQASYDNFVLNSGIEFLTLKTKYSTTYDYEDYIRASHQETTLSEINIPLTLGYKLSINKFTLMPYIGGLYNVNVSFKSEYSYVNTIKESNKRYAVDQQYEDYFDEFYDLKKLQWITGFEVGFNQRMSIDIAYLFSKSYGSYYYGNIDCLFCCLIAPYRRVMSGKEVRISVKYAL